MQMSLRIFLNFYKGMTPSRFGAVIARKDKAENLSEGYKD
jgi:hypothetical protein